MAVPSLAPVSWRQIVAMRRNGSLEALRARIAEAMTQAGTDIEAARTILGEIETRAVDEIVEGGRPRPRKVAIESILANIPGLPVNPASVFFGARDTISAVKKNNKFGWLYLLRDIRAAATPAQG